MAGLADTLVGQGVKPQDTYNVQSQLYNKLGAPQGAYQGSYGQNVWLLGQLGGKNYNDILNGGGNGGSNPGGNSNASSGLPSWAPSQNFGQTASNQMGAAQDYAKSIPQGIADVTKQGNDAVNAAVAGYGAAIPGIINATNEKYQIPEQMSNVQNLNKLGADMQNRINQIQFNTTGQGGGGFAGSNQVDSALQTNYIPKYEQNQTNLNTATTNLSINQAQAQHEQDLLTDPLKLGISAAQENATRSLTGYTAGAQATLNALLALPSMSLQQQQQANDLASKEQEYITTLKSADITGRYGVQAAAAGASGTAALAAAQKFSAELGRGAKLDANGNIIPGSIPDISSILSGLNKTSSSGSGSGTNNDYTNALKALGINIP